MVTPNKDKDETVFRIKRRWRLAALGSEPGASTSAIKAEHLTDEVSYILKKVVLLTKS